jgi:hypothetical protein
MTGNKSVTANFNAGVTYTLTTSATNGSITLNPPGGVYTTGTVVTVTANPNVGYTFGNWSGDLSGSVNPTTITMNGNKSITANFSAPSGGVLPRTGWIVTASVSNVNAPPTNAIDGNLTTRWATGTKQVNGQWFQIDMVSAQTFNRIVLDASSFANDYPRGYQVNVSSDGLNWGTPVATGVGTNVTTISFATQTARYIRVMQTGSVGSTIWWSIGEVNVYAPAASGPPPVLVPTLQAGQLRLEWTGGGMLQTATNPSGLWNNLSGAVSPHLAPTTNAAQFFRIKQ